MLWLSAEICAAELVPLAVNAANTAIDCNCERIADSLACAPYCTVIAESMRAVDEARADPGPELPVYHCTVLAGVPATSDVAELNGVPLTRSGGTGAVMLAPLKPRFPIAPAGELDIDRLAASSV